MKSTILGFFAAVAIAASSAAQAITIAGAIDANGTRQVKSPQYTVSHTTVGHYVIHFKTAFPAPYASCFFMSIQGDVPSGLIEKTTSCDVTFINSAGKLTNTIFNFLAVPTTN